MDRSGRPGASNRQREGGKSLQAELHLDRLGVPGKPYTAADVETKLAAYMAQHGVKDVTVVINNVPCKGPLGCDTLVPILLPEGSTLTVYGVTPQGTQMVKRYTGGATPWWR
ncbi:hypothetical protein F0L68_30800 [Solihabitans fulvus]|uniref:Uncharacterized protein n=1 Tax=Solihabitans fulvus TaxID=1892852 RepID=A0A5B2WTY5_9PSEU|nr:DddA-like double-stranded DNA deaminase toxin [Solihabitans fulvus]KAA2254314.1 hypothetical protein F0L68_30800 [Solihabitans fulvus]